MTEMAIPVEQLRNIGPTIASRLREIGIRSEEELRTVGAVTAYRRLCAKHHDGRMPVCYYLYSLEEIPRNQHWDSLGPPAASG
jgi:DNA transformation protein